MFQYHHLITPVVNDIFFLLAQVIRLLDAQRLSKVTDRNKSKEKGIKELGLYLEEEPNQ